MLTSLLTAPRMPSIFLIRFNRVSRVPTGCKSVYFEAGKAVSNGTTKEEVVAVSELEGVTC